MQKTIKQKTIKRRTSQQKFQEWYRKLNKKQKSEYWQELTDCDLCLPHTQKCELPTYK